MGSQLLLICTANDDSTSLDLNKRYRYDKKDLSTLLDSDDSNDLNTDDGHILGLNKRYRFDKRYRYDRRSNNNEINKRYRFDKRYRYD